jgi:alkyl sulfatase BDS1-like metallo-beta-lactamase superfamily hydrolase
MWSAAQGVTRLRPTTSRLAKIRKEGFIMQCFRPLTWAVGALAVACCGTLSVAQAPKHFSPKGNMPSKYTIKMQEQQRKTLPLKDKKDFEEAKRGFIAAPPYRQIKNDQGEVVWDIDKWNFLLNGKDYNSIHPSLQRQATLNMEYGLFEVVPGIYQVRGSIWQTSHSSRARPAGSLSIH